MPKRRHRSFTPRFKAQVTLEVLSGLRSQAEVARQQRLKPDRIARWTETALGGLESLWGHDHQAVEASCGARPLTRPRGRWSEGEDSGRAVGPAMNRLV